MREILFRGKTKGGRWAYGSLILAGTYCAILESEDVIHPMDWPYLNDEIGTFDGEATPVIPETVGQFIGVSDKMANKIFEGDVLEFDGETEVIIYNGCGFSHNTPTWNHMFSYPIDDGEYGIDPGRATIIGNKWDNPELMEVR